MYSLNALCLTMPTHHSPLTTHQKERIILGIDPGTAVMGYGLIKETGPKIELISLGVVKMEQMDDHMLKLQRIFEKTLALIDNYKPDCMAIEAPFYGKNIQVMLKLGRAQGVCMAAGLSRNIDITEYAPRKIKQSITGNGNAAKEQVAAMLQNLLKFKETPDFLDATDGLAVAVCHAFQRNPGGKSGSKKSYSGWETFAKDNAKRLVGVPGKLK
jgi:crossover junction endodeoxyribonuclease RuvC